MAQGKDTHTHTPDTKKKQQKEVEEQQKSSHISSSRSSSRSKITIKPAMTSKRRKDLAALFFFFSLWPETGPDGNVEGGRVEMGENKQYIHIYSVFLSLCAPY